MELSASLEDYLETILEIVSDKGGARATEIARKRSVANSSVTSAIHSLVELGLVNHRPYDVITLTEKGEEVARAVAERHSVFSDFLVEVLALDRQTAEECACRIEHVIPEEVVRRFTLYLDSEKKCRYRGRKWVEGRGFVCGREEHERLSGGDDDAQG